MNAIVASVLITLLKAFSVLVRLARRLVGAIVEFLAWLQRRINLLIYGHLSFRVRADDIFIVSYPRSGTTVMQMILHTLMADGADDFEHIDAVVPWFEWGTNQGKSYADLPSPRLFKSHLPYFWIPKGPCRYIYVMRDGRDVAISNYYLYQRFNGYRGTFDAFYTRFLRGRLANGSWFRHLRGWQRAGNHGAGNHRTILYVAYEDLMTDRAAEIERIAHFCGIELDAAKRNRVLELSSFAYMKAHEARFDFARLVEPPAARAAFMRAGQSGGWPNQLTAQQARAFAAALAKNHLSVSPDEDGHSCPDTHSIPPIAPWDEEPQ